MYYYNLIIDAPEDKYGVIDGILGVKSNYPEAGWGLQLTEKEEEDHVFFIDYFLSILNERYEQFEKIGITRENISIWVLYEYEGQCNMEFLPMDIYNLGKEGITLCISCWEK